jgi:hypothetical protein
MIFRPRQEDVLVTNKIIGPATLAIESEFRQSVQGRLKKRNLFPKSKQL